MSDSLLFPLDMRSVIIPFSARESGLEILGGKGRSLSRLTALSFPVPEGFTITTAAYDRFVELNGLREKILKAARPEADSGRLSFDRASAVIRELLDRAPWPRDLELQVLQAYENLGESARVAVRSSANAEDLPDMSFAGQQDTYLNINGGANLLAAVSACWASLWTERALGYRFQMGVPSDRLSMAVVVQTMVLSDVSGVIFTANPVTGSREELILNSSFGLGEAIVGGEVTPDQFVVDRVSGKAKQRVIGSKTQKVVGDDNQGTMIAEVAESERSRPSLDADKIAELTAMALRVEQAFEGTPQDIEWLYAGEKLWLVQARPITNLPPAPLRNVTWTAPEVGAFFHRSQIVEHIPGPVSPLFEDLHLRHSLQYEWAKQTCRAGRFEMEDLLAPVGYTVQNTINGYAYRQLGNPTGSDDPPFDFTLQSFRRLAIRLFSPLRVALRRYRPQWWNVLAWRYLALPRYLRQVRRWSRLDVGNATAEQLFKGIRRLSQADARYWYDGGVWGAFNVARVTEGMLSEFLRTHGDGRFTAGQFLVGLKSRAFDAQVSLWRIAEAIRADPELEGLVVTTPPQLLMAAIDSHGAAVQIRLAIASYFAEYGRQIFTLDFAEPLVGEQVEQVMRNLQALVLQSDYDPQAFRRSMIREQKVVSHEASRLFSSKRLSFRFSWIVWRARHYYPNREEAMFYMGYAWQDLRAYAFELGRRLVETGTLSKPDDVFFLTALELGSAVRMLANRRRIEAFTDNPRFSYLNPASRLDTNLSLEALREVAAERRVLREARRRLDPPDYVPDLPPWLWGQRTDGVASDGSARVITGAPVSSGKVTAKVSLIVSPDEFRNMRPGTILVCHATTPAWTQLFSQAVGLVTDIGGSLAHGSIVAREFGIPAVLGTGDVTRRVSHDQLITLDGDKGTVVVHAEVVDAAPIDEPVQASEIEGSDSRIPLGQGRTDSPAWFEIYESFYSG